MTKRIRPQRVAEQIRQEIGTLLGKGIKDPRIGFVSVMNVNMSPDLRYANVYVSLYGDESERKSSLVALRNSQGWVRREIGKNLRLRYTPEIRFFPDETLDTVYHLEEVFQKIQEEEQQAPMRALSLEEIVEELRQAERFVLGTHSNPDGDALGSLLGMAALLRGLGKTDITCVLADPVPEMYRFLPGVASLAAPEDIEHDGWDLAVLLDAGTLERAGDAAAGVLERGRHLLIIDHHLEPGPHGAMGVIDPDYAATGEIVAELFETATLPLGQAEALCLYVAQATDTGGYRFSNTTARSHRIAARLHEAGIDTADLCQRVFDRMSRAKFHLLRLVLDRMAFAAGGRIAHSHVSKQDLDETGARLEDINNLVNYARNIHGVDVGVLFKGMAPAQTKVSMRASAACDVAALMNEFGGGGHAAAAGATVQRPLAEVRAEVLERLEARLGEQS